MKPAVVALVLALASAAHAGTPAPKLDVLFVIDDSGSMAQEQAALSAAFPAFVERTAALLGGAPDLHVGVVSTNLGIGDYPGQSSCPVGGDGGRLVSNPECGVAGAYLIDAGAERNYTGTLGEAFACVATLGTLGCGFEQPLAAARRALDGSNPENDGFVRDDAFLAMVIISDEDDCSAADAAVFDPGQDEIGDPLGPFSSFRCAEFGVVCDGAPIARGAASYATCVPRTGSYLAEIDDLAADLAARKGPGRVFVGVIAAPSAPFAVEINPYSDEPELAASCETAIGSGYPAVRLAAFAAAFAHHTVASICEDDYAPALTDIGTGVALAILEPAADPETTLAPASGCAVGGRGGSLGGVLVLLGLTVVVARRRR